MPRCLLVPLNQMDGIHLTASDTLEIQPRQRLADYENILSRLNALAEPVEQNLALLEADADRDSPRTASRSGACPTRSAA